MGAATETELKEKKARVEDAMHATRAAVEEGIVPGGGVALLRCIPALEKLKAEGDEAVGINIVKRALEEPMRQIAHNAGFEGAVVIGKVRESKDDNFGFNAETGEYGDMVKMGVIDPAKVTRLALQNAASIAGLMLTTEALVADIREKEEKAAGAAPHGGRRHGRRNVLNVPNLSSRAQRGTCFPQPHPGQRFNTRRPVRIEPGALLFQQAPAFFATIANGLSCYHEAAVTSLTSLRAGVGAAPFVCKGTGLDCTQAKDGRRRRFSPPLRNLKSAMPQTPRPPHPEIP